MQQFRFNYKTLEDFTADLERFKLELPISEDLSLLKAPVTVGGKKIPNRLGIQPMEGCDALADGSPGELTFRRYLRFARGGSGLIWFEATAASEAGRGKPTQLYLHEGNVDSFAKLVDQTRQAGLEASGEVPYLVLQLTHAGRYGDGKVIAVHEPELDRRAGVDPQKPVITDEELQALEDDFVAAARLAKQAGFDAVDIKACHRYLISELLGAHNRPGNYGGSYENRTRWLKNVIGKIRNAGIDIDITTRLNAYDAIAYPYGWGSDSTGGIDLAEPKRLVQELVSLGLSMINITIATPYLTPHISRPYDQPGRNGYPQPEHPLVGVARILNVAKEIQLTVPDCVIVGTGFSWLRQFAPYVAAGMIKEGWASICGFGRGGFAYPDFAKDIFTTGAMSPRKVCISCSKCSELKGAAWLTGCVVRDSEVYAPIYQDFIKATGGK